MAINPLTSLTSLLHEHLLAGGSYVGPMHRMFFQSLALMVNAHSILETGYDTGLTTMAFAMTGAEVIAIDNEFEYSSYKNVARQRVHHYPNVSLVNSDALVYLLNCPDERFDVIFIDDCHWAPYTAFEVEEVQRLIRPGGIVIFHDTLSYPLEAVVREGFPATWDRIQLPCIQSWNQYSGNRESLGYDFGIMIARRPYDTPLAPAVGIESPDEMPELITQLFNARSISVHVASDTGLSVEYDTGDGAHVRLTETEIVPLVPDLVAILRFARCHAPLQAVQQQALDALRMVLKGYGTFASVLAGRSEKTRKAEGIFGKKVANVTIG